MEMPAIGVFKDVGRKSSSIEKVGEIFKLSGAISRLYQRGIKSFYQAKRNYRMRYVQRQFRIFQVAESFNSSIN